jgi:hypothetical protein
VYAYDALNRRISQTVNNNPTTDFYYSAQGQILEEDVLGNMQRRNVWSAAGISALVYQYNGNYYYAQQDANWNVTGQVISGAYVYVHAVYDPYGNATFYDHSWNPGGGQGERTWNDC